MTGRMPVVPMKEILDRALADRYGVAAFNIINDLSIEAVLAAAVEERAPVILQTSVKTVRQYGRDQLAGIFRALMRGVDVPVTDEMSMAILSVTSPLECTFGVMSIFTPTSRYWNWVLTSGLMPTPPMPG